MSRLRAIAGISVFWVGLSVVGDAFMSIVVVTAVAAAAPAALTATAVGLVTLIGIGAGMLVQPVAGAVSDALRPVWGRRGQLLAGAGLLIAALGAFAGASGLVALAVAVVLVQVAAATAQAAQQALIPDLVEPGWRGRASGAKGFADLGGAFIGFALLAAVAGPRPEPAILAVATLVAATAIAAVLLVREPRGVPRLPGRQPGVTSAAARAFRLDLPDRGTFARVVGARFLFLLATFTVGRYLLLILSERLGMPVAEAGAAAATLFAVLTLVTALASLPAGWIADRRGRRGVIVAGALLSAAGGVAFLAAPDFASVVLAGSVMAIGSAAFATASWAWTTDLVDAGAAGRHMGIANLGTAGAAAAAGLFGVVIDASRAYLLPGLGFAVALVPAIALFVASALVARSARQDPLPGSGPAAHARPVGRHADPLPEVPGP